SHFPLSLVPDYHPGQHALTDVAVPADLQADSLVYFSAELPPSVSEKLKQTRIVVRAGDVVTEEVLPQLQAIRQYQLAQRQPRRLVGLLVIVTLLYFALYKVALSNQSNRLGSRAAFWVAASMLALQTLLVRAGMFTAAVLSTRPET